MVNRPHVFANLLDRSSRPGPDFPDTEAARHPERESLTSFIGIHELQEIDHNTEPWPVAEGDTILLASDGMFKTLDPAEILACLSGHPQSWPQALVARTLDPKRYPAQDNVTVNFDNTGFGRLASGALKPRPPRCCPRQAVPAATRTEKRYFSRPYFCFSVALLGKPEVANEREGITCWILFAWLIVGSRLVGPVPVATGI